MKNIKVKFDVWIQFLGMLGVLGGLVFVGLEMQQAHLIAEAGQQQERLRAAGDRGVRRRRNRKCARAQHRRAVLVLAGARG